MRKTIVILSGWASQDIFFEDMINALSTKYRIIFMDFNRVNSIDEIYSHAYNLVSSLEDVEIISWSMGSIVALKLAATLKNIKRLIVISGFPRFASCIDYKYGIKDSFVKNMMLGLSEQRDTTLLRFYKKIGYRQRENLNTLLFPNVDSLSLGLEFLLQEDVRYSIEKIGIPVDIIHSVDDKIVSVESARYLDNNLINSRLYIFKSGGHMPFKINEKEIIEIISNQ